MQNNYFKFFIEQGSHFIYFGSEISHDMNNKIN